METSSAKLNRRKFLVAATAGTVIAGAGITWRYADSRERWIEAIVRGNLPGITLEESSLRQFVSEILAGDLLASHTHRLAVFAKQAVPWVTARIPMVRDGLDRLERRVLTEYLIGSSFFRVPDPKQEPIVYYGRSIACANPFVSFG